MQRKRQGFTLVELSIVLVIVGLLIGGILAAQSMIHTAKVQAFVREIQQFDIAVDSFRTKYRSLPGDSTLFDPAGNGDTLLQDADGGGVKFTGEIANFWPHLQTGGFSYRGMTFSATVPGAGFNLNSQTPNAPKAALDSNYGVVVVVCGNDDIYDPPCYQILDAQGIDISSQTMYSSRPVASPTTALAIDTKWDDGGQSRGV